AVYFFSSSVYAQSGWDLIRENDFKKAAQAFSAELEKDSTNLSALKGMIFISETTGDSRSSEKYINTLLNNHWNENYYFLFSSSYNGDPQKILEKRGASERIKIEPKLAKADELYNKRKKEESYIHYKEVFGDYKWTFLGPFDNLNGSAYA